MNREFWTSALVGEAMGVSQMTLFNWRNGIRKYVSCPIPYIKLLGGTVGTMKYIYDPDEVKKWAKSQDLLFKRPARLNGKAA